MKKGFSSLTKFSFVFVAFAGLALLFGSGVFGDFTPNVSVRSNSTLDSSLIGYWTFDGGNLLQNASDSSTGGNTGYLKNFTATTTLPGRVGQGLSFDGVNDYVTAGDIAAVDSATTLSACAWVYHDTVTADGNIIGKSNVATDGVILFRDDVGSVSGRTDIYTIYIADSADTDQTRVESATGSSPVQRWTHVCMTFTAGSATGLRLYINGSEDANSPASTASITAVDAGTNPVTIGVFSDLSTSPFDGVIDDVRLYTRVLSSAEVTRIYQIGATTNMNVTVEEPSNSPVINGLVQHWTFDAGTLTSTTATNKVSGGASGTLTTVATAATSTYTSAGSTSFVVPNGVTQIFAKAWGGGGGGSGGGSAAAGAAGGGGGYATSTITVTPGESLTVYVGGGGGAGLYTTTTAGGGGTNGGGGGSAAGQVNVGSGGGGGGYSGVFRSATALMVAAGGAGAGGGNTGQSGKAGGAGGGTIGADGTNNGTTNAQGFGGTQSAGGAAGVSTGQTTAPTAGTSLQGGAGGVPNSADRAGGGGGGGGYFGGGGGAGGTGGTTLRDGSGGGGGSSYVGGGTAGGAHIGSGATPGNDGDADRSSVADGGAAGGTAGAGGVGDDGKTLIGYVTPGTAPSARAGKVGQGVYFPGSSYITAGDIGSGKKTIAFWVKATTAASQKIINIDGTDQIETNGSAAITATSFPGTTVVYVDGSTASAVITTGWHHVVITDTTGVAGTTFEIGRVGSTYFTGVIDDVRVYSRVLDQTEVTRLYQLGATSYINTTTSVQSQALTTGLVGHWTFDGARLLQNVTDSSTSANTSYLANFTSTTTVAGRIGQAIDLDGTDDYIRVPDANSLDVTNVTIAAWIKRGSSNVAGAGIVCKGNGGGGEVYCLDFPSTNSLLARFYLWKSASATTVTASTALTSNTWGHVAATFDGTTLTIYINGVSAGTASRTASLDTNTHDLTIGCRQSGSTTYDQCLDAVFDDVRVYNAALSGPQILRLYQMGLGR